MTGAEQLAVWLFGIFCGSVAVCRIVRLWAASRATVGVVREVAAARAEALRVELERQQGPHFVPPAWLTQDGES